MSDFLETVTAAFGKLIGSETLAVISDQYDEEAFGNAAVVLSGGNVLIRLVRDRGDVFADAASATFPNDWAPLERTLLAVGALSAPREGLLSPRDAADLVEKYFTMLAAGLSGTRLAETRARLLEMKRFKSAEAMHRLKGGSAN